jgi:CubicO group peptidase (beta-lactamase class C family)
MSHASRLGRSPVARLLSGALLLGGLPGVALAASSDSRIAGGDPVAAIAKIFAKSAVDRGAAVGVGLGILMSGRPPRLFSYGLADAVSGQSFGPDLAFEIGSVTKVFTTNLLGQEIYLKQHNLNDPLSAFSVQLGSFKPLTREITLEQLADFTAGVPDLAPLCKDAPHVPGCLKSDRPTPDVYTAQDFLKFFQNTVPKNYQDTNPPPVTSLPAPYFYSDFSIGLLGLILGGNPNVPLSNQALNGWVSLLKNRLLHPLRMEDTYLYPSPGRQVSIVLGYNQAVGSAVVANGQVSGITLEVPGSGYRAPPEVSFVSGGGKGAQATAMVDKNGAVTGFKITKGGHGYVAPPTITFSAGPAKAKVIVSNQKVVGINIIDAGSGYTTAPEVMITGGHRNGIGRDARGTAHIANGQVSFVSIDDGGDRYEQPAAVIVEPGMPIANGIPIWAPAGALHSTIRDTTVFAAAALRQTRRGRFAVDPAIAAGFKIAETPYACTGKDPGLSGCPPGTPLSCLAWGIRPEDMPNNVPAILSKNGGLPGFSTQVLVMPARSLAVVVFVNSNGDTDTGETIDTDRATSTRQAEKIGRNILYALYYELVQPNSRP